MRFTSRVWVLYIANDACKRGTGVVKLTAVP